LIRKLWRYRALTLSLVRRQYQLRYRQSLVGFAWAIIPVFASLAVATIVFHRVIGVNTGKVPYALFTLAGLAPWTFFASGLSTGIPVVAMSQQMVSRLAFPRAALPLAIIGTSLIDLGVTAVAFVIYAYATGAGLPATALWFPVLVLIEIVLASGLALLGSALNVFARDIRLMVPLLLQLWLFLTPVMYPLSHVKSSTLLTWFRINPMTGVVESFRDILIDGHAPSLSLLTPAIIGAVVVFVVGAWYFGATESRFADVV
jgi:ABC-type polysaccharide/polyol phosphate export permease